MRRRFPLVPLALTFLMGLVGFLPAAPAQADGETLTLTAPPRVRIGQPTVLTSTFTDQAGAPLPGVVVDFTQLVSGAWVSQGTATTDASGTATFTKTTRRPESVYRSTATPTGASPVVSPQVSVIGYQVRTAITLSTSSWSVPDGQSRTLSSKWTTLSGEPIVGRVTLFSNPGNGTWTRVSSATTTSAGSAGSASWVVRPLRDYYYKVTGPAGSYWLAASSPVRHMDNIPPGVPVSYPSAAPRPASLPAQARAVGAGANASITAIPDAIWNNMVGRSWHRGCPIGRAYLRLIRINYWDFAGYRRRGEVVVRSSIASKTAGALRDMYAGKYPIRAMYRVDRFGWSDRVNGADDYASMRHDNTSAFNCRDVVGNPGTRSPHAYGKAIDINTWENPYNSAQGIVPNTWWYTRSHPRIAWRSGEHPVVRIWRNRGFRWTYGTQDSQHFDGRYVPMTGTFVAD